MESLRHWVDEDREELRFERRLVDDAHEWKRSGEAGELLRGTSLKGEGMVQQASRRPWRGCRVRQGPVTPKSKIFSPEARCRTRAPRAG